jgi:polysaccharide biosynthesis transport protein
MAGLGDNGSTIDFSAYSAALRRRLPLIGACVAVLVGVSLVYSLTATSTYAATSRLLVQQGVGEQLFSEGGGGALDFNAARRIEGEIEVLESGGVRALVEAELGPDAPEASAAQVGQGDIIAITVRSADAELAAATANAYATAYVTYRRDQAVGDLLEASVEVERRIGELVTQRTSLPESAVAERDALSSQIIAFQERLNQFQVDASLRSGGAQVTRQADTPEQPVAPRPFRNAVLAAIAAALVGLGIASLLELVNDRLRSRSDVEQSLHNSVLGVIPRVGRADNPVIDGRLDDESPSAEAYRTLRTAIQFIGLERERRDFQITSARAGDGKSTTAANLGVVLAQAGRTVLLIDADLRKPRLGSLFGFGTASGTGLTAVLSGDVTLTEAVRPLEIPGLSILTSGTRPPNPSELLGLPVMEKVLSEAADQFDIVLVDTPPLLPVTDGFVVAGIVSGTIVVVNAQKNSRRELRQVCAQVGRVGGTILGVVLNRANGRDDTSYKYGYGYGYGVRRQRPWSRRRPSSSRRVIDLSETSVEV